MTTTTKGHKLMKVKATDVKCPVCAAEHGEYCRTAHAGNHKSPTCTARAALARRVSSILTHHFTIAERPCNGEAHKPEVGGMIDHCMVCMPKWGVVDHLAPIDFTTPTKTEKLTKAQWLVLDTIATEGGWTHMDADAFKALMVAEPRPAGYRARSAKRGAVLKTTRALVEAGLLVRFSYILRNEESTRATLCTDSGLALTEAGYAALKRTGDVLKLATLVSPHDYRATLRLEDIANERVISKWFSGWKIDRSAPGADAAVAVVQARAAVLEAERAKEQAVVDLAWAEAKAHDATLPRGTLATSPNLSWAPEVIADSSGKWCGNALRFATREEAEANVRNLSWRWMLVRETRVVESADPVNYQWDVERGLVDVRKVEA